MAFDAMEPIGEKRSDFRNGYLMSLIANIHSKKGSEPFTPIDFMPFIDEAIKQKRKNEKMRSVFKYFQSG